MSGFHCVYKRHTPFSISSQQYVGNHIILDKTGDIMLYAYLFSETLFDWSQISSVDMYIGGELVCSWDTKYITLFYPLLSSSTYSKSAYDDTTLFLPIPVPMLPLKNMRYHQCEFKIVWRTTPQPLKFIVTYAFVDETIPDCDILVQQVKKVSVVDGEPIRLNGLVKYMVSDTIQQPTSITYDGRDVIVPIIDVYKYYHTKHGETRERFFKFGDVDLGMPRTCQRLDDRIFIFSSMRPYVYMYDTDTFFGYDGNYVPIYTGYMPVLSSCLGDEKIYAAALSGELFSLDYKGTFTDLNFKTEHEVYSMHYYNNRLFFIGLRDMTIYNTTDGTSRIIGLYEKHNGSFVENNIIFIFRDDGSTGVTLYNMDTDTISLINSLNIAEYETQLYNLYNQFSSSIVVDGVSYIASGYNNIFQAGNEVFTLPREEQEYMTLIFDGKNKIFVYGRKSIFRYSLNKYTMFVPFCLDVNDTESTGYINFNMIKEVKLNGCGNGTMFTVNYNFLRIQNGMSGILYAH